MDVFLRVLHLQEEHLSDDGVCDAVINACSDENDAVLEQSGVDVKSALSSAVRFDDGGDKVIILRSIVSGMRSWDHELLIFSFSFWFYLGNGRVLDQKVNGLTKEHVLADVVELTVLLDFFRESFEWLFGLLSHESDALEELALFNFETFFFRNLGE